MARVLDLFESSIMESLWNDLSRAETSVVVVVVGMYVVNSVAMREREPASVVMLGRGMSIQHFVDLTASPRWHN